MPDLPRFTHWPQDAVDVDPADIPALYESGKIGCIYDSLAHEQFAEWIDHSGGVEDGSKAVKVFGLEGNGAGKLSLPYLSAWSLWPGCWPGPGQTTGDCVSWGTKNSCLTTIGCEILDRKPDEVSGKVEGPPEVAAEAITQGVFSTEVIYGHRGHSGQGASCDRLAGYVTQVGGLMVRRPYPELNLDLTRYNSSIGARWGGGGTPDNVSAIAKQHSVRTATFVRDTNTARDLLASGYGINTCSGLGFSSSRNEDGLSERKGSWSHSQAIIGCDDRPDTVSKYGGKIFLWCNSWGKWNSGPRRIRGTEFDIPDGCYWVRESVTNQAQMIAFSGVNGWPARKLVPIGWEVPV